MTHVLRVALIALLVWLQIFPAYAAPRFWVGGTGTADLSDTTHWSATTGGGGGASVPGSADSVTFDAASGGGTVTVNANFTWVNLTMGAFTGTLDFAANDNNITISGAFSGTGTGARTLNMGDGTWTLTGANGAIWDNTTATNFNFNANGSTLLIAGAPVLPRTLVLGTTLSYNIITANPTSGDAYPLVLLGTTVTIATLNITAPAVIHFSAASTYNITNAYTFSGTAVSPIVLLGIGSGTMRISTASGTATCAWCVIGNLTFQGGATFTASNSLDLGNNAGISPFGTPGAGGGSIFGQ